MNPTVTAYRLGQVEYVDGLELQRQFIEARRAERIGDSLLLLEHPPVLTLGRGAEGSHIIAPRQRLEALGVEVHETDRGGDVTYHGPGQLVGYPLLHLGPGRQDVRKYVRCIEEVAIRTLADFGITATRIEKWPGVWVEGSRRGGPRKICALGVHLSRWYTRHGFALNLETNLSHFELIVPCGISEAGVTSMVDELEQPVDRSKVEAAVIRHFAEVFECEVVEGAAPVPTVGVVIVSGDRFLLLRRSEARGGFWQPVTGHIEPGETPDQAATRELKEETGFVLEPHWTRHSHAFPWGYAEVPKIGLEHLYVARLDDERVPALGEEHDAFEWMSFDQALERVPFAGFKRGLRLARSPG